jgi:hypothetical protein
MERIDQLIAENCALRAEAQEVRWRAEQARQRARLAKLEWQETQQEMWQRLRQTSFTLWAARFTITPLLGQPLR